MINQKRGKRQVTEMYVHPKYCICHSISSNYYQGSPVENSLINAMTDTDSSI